MPKVIINNIEYVKKTCDIKAPENNINATHFAILPDDSNIFYIINDGGIQLYLPVSKAWLSPATVPFTLYSFDDY